MDPEKRDRDQDQDLESNRWKSPFRGSIGFFFLNEQLQIQLDRLWHIPRVWDILALDSEGADFLQRCSLSWEICEALLLLIQNRLSRVRHIMCHENEPIIEYPNIL